MDGKQAPKTNVGTFDFPEDEECDQPFTIKGKFNGVDVEVSSGISNNDNEDFTSSE